MATPNKIERKIGKNEAKTTQKKTKTKTKSHAKERGKKRRSWLARIVGANYTDDASLKHPPTLITADSDEICGVCV